MKRNKQSDLVDMGSAAIDKAKTAVAPYVEQAQDKAQNAVDALSPHLATAKAGVLVARDKVGEVFNDEVMPRLNAFAESPADNPTTREARRRSRAAMAALRGDWDVKDKELDKLAKKHAKDAEKQRAQLAKDFRTAVEKKKAPKSSKAKAFGKFVLIASIVGAAAVIVRQLFAAKKDDPWQSYEPSSYTPPAKRTEPAETAEFAKAPADTEVKDDAQVDETETKDAASNNGYGEGAFVGTEPPEGFTIKGNERSMKYHVEGSESYDRTIADVWFNSEKAAEAAGFTRAHR